ncbi:hypothetical protein Ae201684P_021996 [Aphanomyces euteiches]|nr:hypothetical protein Ae201684P_021996 [Aphanomyces euteiches]
MHILNRRSKDMSKQLPRVEVLSKTNVSLTVSITPASTKMQPTASTATSTTRGLKSIWPRRHIRSRDCSPTSVMSRKRVFGMTKRTPGRKEETKRSSTYYEHALKMEKEQRQAMQHQIERLQKMLTEPSTAWMSKRLSRSCDRKSMQAQSMEALEKMRKMDEQVITDLLAEQEKLRQLQSHQSPTNKRNLNVSSSSLKPTKQMCGNIKSSYCPSSRKYKNTSSLLRRNRAKLRAAKSKLMDDCRRMMQEHADIAHCKQLELEDALLEAKLSLEKQLENNQLMHEEMQRLRHENASLKQSIEEFDSKIAPKLVDLEEENALLKAQLRAMK